MLTVKQRIPRPLEKAIAGPLVTLAFDAGIVRVDLDPMARKAVARRASR